MEDLFSLLDNPITTVGSYFLSAVLVVYKKPIREINNLHMSLLRSNLHKANYIIYYETNDLYMYLIRYLNKFPYARGYFDCDFISPDVYRIDNPSQLEQIKHALEDYKSGILKESPREHKQSLLDIDVTSLEYTDADEQKLHERATELQNMIYSYDERPSVIKDIISISDIPVKTKSYSKPKLRK